MDVSPFPPHSPCPPGSWALACQRQDPCTDLCADSRLREGDAERATYRASSCLALPTISPRQALLPSSLSPLLRGSSHGFLQTPRLLPPFPSLDYLVVYREASSKTWRACTHEHPGAPPPCTPPRLPMLRVPAPPCRRCQSTAMQHCPWGRGPPTRAVRQASRLHGPRLAESFASRGQDDCRGLDSRPALDALGRADQGAARRLCMIDSATRPEPRLHPSPLAPWDPLHATEADD